MLLKYSILMNLYYRKILITFNRKTKMQIVPKTANSANILLSAFRYLKIEKIKGYNLLFLFIHFEILNKWEILKLINTSVGGKENKKGSFYDWW